MADIKIREADRGSIKTLDIAGAATNRMKDSYVRSKIRTREEVLSSDGDTEKNVPAEAYDEMSAGAVIAGSTAGKKLRKTIKPEVRESDTTFTPQESSDFTEHGKEKFKLGRQKAGSRKRKTREEASSDTENHDIPQSRKVVGRNNKRFQAGKPSSGSLQQRQKNYWIRKVRQNGDERDVIYRIKLILFGGSQNRNNGNSLRAAVSSINLQNLTIAAASSIAVLIIVLFTFFGSAFYSPGGEKYSDDPTLWNVYGNGSAALVNVAKKEIGNVGGDKYWSWYGFSSHVHWCACFVSWCENECDYLKAGAAPKFALVSDGANWFKKKGQWAGRLYTPKPGDIIFFDWDSDGSLDHVGIVEFSDGKTVHTIEGNSGNACKCQAYTRGRSPIVGYGLIYTSPALNAQKIVDKANELAYTGSPSEAKYPGGKPTSAYAAALDRSYPNRTHWGKAPRAGASCDVFVGTCIVDSGVDPDFPRGLDEQQPYLAESDKFECVVRTTDRDIRESELRDGDIITYRYKGGGGHICIYWNGKLKHAALKSWYGRTSSPGGRFKIHGKKWICVYRAKG